LKQCSIKTAPVFPHDFSNLRLGISIFAHYPGQVAQPGDVLKSSVYGMKAAKISSDTYPVGAKRLGYPVDVAENVLDGSLPGGSEHFRVGGYSYHAFALEDGGNLVPGEVSGNVCKSAHPGVGR